MTSRKSYYKTIGAGRYKNNTVLISGDEINSRVEKALEELKAKIAEKEAVNKSSVKEQKND